MDAYGNLTGLDEFSGNRKVRLVSYLDPDVVLGVFPPSASSYGAYRLGVRRLSLGDPETSLWSIYNYKIAPGYFTLVWDGAYGGQCLSGQSDGDGQLVLVDLPAIDDTGDTVARPEFTVNFVDGCWFKLTAADYVIDISESGTVEGNPIIAFGWNGGPNQIWRAETVANAAMAADEGAAIGAQAVQGGE